MIPSSLARVRPSTQSIDERPVEPEETDDDVDDMTQKPLLSRSLVHVELQARSGSVVLEVAHRKGQLQGPLE
jgi:hypothetical protein